MMVLLKSSFMEMESSWVQPQGDITGITIVDPGEPRSFSEPPTVSITGGGPGVGAEATATIDENGTLTGIQIVSGGKDYTTPPAIVLTPSNGAIVSATIDSQIRNSVRRIEGTNRWVAEWNAQIPGTYNISVEAIDDASRSTRISSNRYITIIPKGPSKSPCFFIGSTKPAILYIWIETKIICSSDDLDGFWSG